MTRFELGRAFPDLGGPLAPDSMVDRAVSVAEVGSRRDGMRHEVHCPLDSVPQGHAEGQVGRDTSGEGAARSVGVRGREARSAPGSLCAPVPEHVQDLIPRQMSALHEGCPRPHAHQFPRRPRHVGRGGYVAAGEDASFMEIRGDQFRLGQQLPHERFLSVLGQQSVARGRNHHRVQDETIKAVMYDRSSYPDHQLSRGEHSGLGGHRIQVVHYGIDLRSDHLEGDGVHGRYPHGVLCCDRGDGARAEDTEGLEGLEIGLDSRTPTAVAAGDREGDGGTRSYTVTRLGHASDPGSRGVSEDDGKDTGGRTDWAWAAGWA